TSAWTENGPVSIPSRPIAYTAAAVLALVAAAGLGLGFKAALRGGVGAVAGASGKAADDGATDAQPIVVLPPPVAAPAQQAKKDDQTDAEKAQEAAAKAAAAQQIQAKPSKPDQNIDDILTSASEKPPAPVKPATDEAPPATRSDVPY
ncbi:MAG TPA: hypothetical protein VG939_10970, partial [Caulobacteraceae bacterium]|nr:hypothetical protein [Caulobacteraceae bacterium]